MGAIGLTLGEYLFQCSTFGITSSTGSFSSTIDDKYLQFCNFAILQFYLLNLSTPLITKQYPQLVIIDPYYNLAKCQL